MIKIEETKTFGWEAAIRGMRNPMNSWDKSDTHESSSYCPAIDKWDGATEDGFYLLIGDNDLNLMRRLCKAGSDHRKFMRMIFVSCDITAPLYWWKEFDTYKVGTSANSCSTMHMIHAKDFTLDDFSHEHLINDEDLANYGAEWTTPLDTLKITISSLNGARRAYLKTKDKKYWWQMIQLLPSSYNQKRTVTMNYEVLANIYESRKTHKLDEWRDFCDWIKKFPHSELITSNRDHHDSFLKSLRSTYGTLLDEPIARALILGEPITEEMIAKYEHSKE